MLRHSQVTLTWKNTWYRIFVSMPKLGSLNLSVFWLPHPTSAAIL